MRTKIRRNDLCPCGSGKKYKNCCQSKPDNPEYSDITKFPDLYKVARREARFKECIHPDKEHCSERIVGAHSIQNNKILSKISDNGVVYMPCPKSELNIGLQYIYGRKEASVFSGFCSYHDKVTFQPIEDTDFSGTSEQIFLHVYRAFALEYHRKKEAARLEQHFFKNKPSIAAIPFRMIEGKTGFNLAVSDFEQEKHLFDKALLEKKYDVLTSFVWSFDGFSNFAATGAEAPTLDFSSKKIQNLLNPKVPARHIYTIVFPENDKTYAIIAWLKEYDKLFATIKDRLCSLTESEKRNYINNTIPMVSENIVIKPSSWNAMSKSSQEEFHKIFYGLPDLIEMTGQKFDRFVKRSFDLFTL